MLRKSIAILARIRREETQQQQQVFAKAQREANSAANALARARNTMKVEEQIAADNPQIVNPFYLSNAQARVNELAARLEHLQGEQAQSKTKLIDNYQREKLSEKFVEKRKQQDNLTQEKQEHKEIESLGETRASNKAYR